MAEGLGVPRSRKPLKNQPPLMPVNMSEQPKQEPYLAEMDIERGGVDIKVRLFSTRRKNDPRPFRVEDLDGNEVELNLKEQAIGEVAVLGDITADTMDMINSQSLPPWFKRRFRR